VFEAPLRLLRLRNRGVQRKNGKQRDIQSHRFVSFRRLACADQAFFISLGIETGPSGWQRFCCLPG
jgi:hypothetical protein